MNTKHLDSLRDFWTAEKLDEAGRRVAASISNEDQKKVDAGTSAINKILDGIPHQKDWRVLEIGCGFGRIVKPMCEIFDIVDGVDISETILKRAKEYLCGLHGVGELRLNNGYDLQPAQDNTYNLVYSVLVFQHIRSASVIRSYLKETARVLKPEGYFRLQVHKWKETFGHYDNESDKAIWGGNAYTEEEITSLVADAGMTVVRVDTDGPHIWVTAQK